MSWGQFAGSSGLSGFMSERKKNAVPDMWKRIGTALALLALSWIGAGLIPTNHVIRFRDLLNISLNISTTGAIYLAYFVFFVFIYLTSLWIVFLIFGWKRPRALKVAFASLILSVIGFVLWFAFVFSP